MSQDLGNALAALRERFASAASTTVAAFERLARQLDTAPQAAAVLTALRRELHRVHGTAGSVGFEEASRLAASMETLATRWLDDPSLDGERRGALVGEFARSLRESLAQPAAAEAPGAARESTRLLLVDLSDAIASGLIAEGLSRGSRVERITAGQLAGAVAQERPAGIIALDTAIPAGMADGVPRILLRSPGVDVDVDVDGAVAGQRTLDARTEPAAILSAITLLQQVTGAQGGSVVIVDDDPVVRRLLTLLLEHDGLRVVARSSARGFMAAVRDANPLLLVCDVDLPRSSGVSLAKRIRASPEFADLPILMLTGHADPATRTSAFAAGADDYMLKPIVPAEFRQRVGRLMETRRQRRASGGLHEVTGLALRARTMREIESTLRSFGGRPASVCVVRPVEPPIGDEREAAWHRESARVARAVRARDGFAGLIDAVAVGGALGMPAAETRAMLAALRGDAPDGAPPWRAGVAGVEANHARSARILLDAAEAACLGARETG